MTKPRSNTGGAVEFDLTAADRALRSEERLLALEPGLAHDAGAVPDSAFLLTLARGGQG